MNEDQDECPCKRYKYGMVRLCEGKSIMLTPQDTVLIDMDRAQGTFRTVLRVENEFVKVEWNGTLVTMYRKGSMLFYHLDDRNTAERYATDILNTDGVAELSENRLVNG